MARYRGKKAVDSAIALIIIGFIVAFLLIKLAITLILILFPLAILAGFIYYFILSKKYATKINEAKRGFYLTNEEKNELNKLSYIIDEANRNIKKTNEQADNLGLSRNMDGSISLRSNKGKELSQVIGRNYITISNNIDKYEQLRDLPQIRYSKYVAITSRKGAFLFSLASYILGLPILMLVFLHSLSGETFEKVMLFPSKILSNNNSNTPEGHTIWTLLGIVVLFLLVGGFISKLKIQKDLKTP